MDFLLLCLCFETHDGPCWTRCASGVAEAGPHGLAEGCCGSVPVVLLRRVSTFIVQKSVEMPQVYFPARVVDVPVVLQRQVLALRKVYAMHVETQAVYLCTLRDAQFAS